MSKALSFIEHQIRGVSPGAVCGLYPYSGGGLCCITSPRPKNPPVWALELQ